MFRFNYKQTQFFPDENNYCGGLALAAALNFVNGFAHNQPDPMHVYRHIQLNQDELEEEVMGTLELSRVNNTDICLPSSIALTTEGFGIHSVVYYDMNLIPSLRVILEFERRRYSDIRFNPNNSLKSSLDYLSQHKGFVILIDDHWVALGRSGNGEIHGYDPEQSFPTGVVKIEQNRIVGYPYDYAGVIIGL